MAGVLNIKEYLFHDGSSNEAAVPKVLHEYGRRVKVAVGTPPLNMARAMGPILSPEPLTLSERLGQEAFDLRRSTEFLQEKRQRAHENRSWGAPGAGGPTPLVPPGIPVIQEGPVGAPTACLSDRMAGRIALGTIIVSGPTPDLQFVDDELVKIQADVQEALSWLGSRGPVMDITWVQEIRVVEVDVPNTATGQGFEAYEATWRDAALRQLGHQPGMGGIFSYALALKNELNAERAFCALFTKYRLWHFAYADLGGPRLTMHFANNGWGPGNIDRVFAHEACHIFGAPDEYAASGCSTGGRHGVLGWPNDNCQNGAANGGVECIMRNNSWTMCDYTRHHLGYTGLAAPPSP